LNPEAEMSTALISGSTFELPSLGFLDESNVVIGNYTNVRSVTNLASWGAFERGCQKLGGGKCRPHMSDGTKQF
jgi:hypothetical protein